MQTSSDAVLRAQLWVGRILTAIAILFCLFDAVSKLIRPAPVVEATIGLGYKEAVIVPLGLTLLVCTLLYAIPRTSVLGAILLTGYLGGAVASNVRAETPLFNVLFPILFAAIAWGGIWFRDSRLREIMPLVANRHE
jgi:hypothetical protein